MQTMPARNTNRDFGWLAGFLLSSFAAAGLGGIATSAGLKGWYQSLRKPSWTPPNRIFGPVWTILYIQMAISAWLVRREMTKHPEKSEQGKEALVAWGTQISLNLLWSLVFFGSRRLGGGLAVIVALWAAIAGTARLSGRVSRPAGLLLLPYLLWTTFATALNARTFELNRGR